MDFSRKCTLLGSRLTACDNLIHDLEDELANLPIKVCITIPIQEEDITRILWDPKEKHIIFSDSRVYIPLICTTEYCKIIVYPFLHDLRKKAKAMVDRISQEGCQIHTLTINN